MKSRRSSRILDGTSLRKVEAERGFSDLMLLDLPNSRSGSSRAYCLVASHELRTSLRAL